jgi:hypothetical protein
MPDKPSSKWFSDDGPGLDRFGMVLALSFLSITVLSLIDLDNATSGVRSRIGWVVVTLTVAGTLAVTLRTAGVARRPRRIAEILLVIGVVVVVMVIAISLVPGVDTIPGIDSAEPSVLWAFITMISPVLVLRRVMMQRTVTMSTLYGAVSVYLLVALAFNYAFLGIDNVIGGEPFFGTAESSSSFTYYSLTTITTVGYGDLAAVGDLGRFLSSAEAVIGQVLLVTVVARLVSLYSRPPETEAAAEGQSRSVTVE